MYVVDHTKHETLSTAILSALPILFSNFKQLFFVSSYLELYLFLSIQQISLPINTAFGQDSQGGQWVVDRLLQKVLTNLIVWSSEHELAKDTIDLMVSIVDRKDK